MHLGLNAYGNALRYRLMSILHYRFQDFKGLHCQFPNFTVLWRSLHFLSIIVYTSVLSQIEVRSGKAHEGGLVLVAPGPVLHGGSESKLLSVSEQA